VGGRCFIVGIGASAGGLEALEQFLSRVPERSGLAFVVVQHLDPTREGLMPELLQRVTKMTVAQVKDGVRVQPDHVYVIPPNKDLSILGGALHLLAPASPRGLRLPIDYFFRALADDQLERSVGVILSGMGTDGTLGLKKVKEHGGVVLVQDPASAKFDSMPRSAIEAGLADVVAPAEELPGRLITFLRLATRPAAATPGPERHQAGFEKIVLLLRDRSGHDFSNYKKSTLYRRIERRMALHQLEDIASYVRYLQENVQEQDLLFNELLIGVTRFFRDEDAWNALRDVTFPALFSRNPKGGTLRAWAAGCSTGEEAYSLAIVFLEALERKRPKARFTFRVFATDLDRNAVEKARQGLYPPNISSDVSPKRLRRFFVKEEGGSFRVTRELREMVTFAPHDLVKDAPFTKLDVVVCRNVLIYLEPELQRRLISLFHYSLARDGMLFLGSSETVGTSQVSLFDPINAKLRLYRREESAVQLGRADFPPTLFSPNYQTPRVGSPAKTVSNLQALADELVLRQLCPAAVLVSDKGELLYLNGRTGKYLEPPAGKVNWNVFAMATDGLRAALRAAFQRATRQQRPATARGTAAGADGRPCPVDVTVTQLQKPDALRGTLLISFHDVPTAGSRGASKGRRSTGEHPRLAELQREIRELHDELRSTREDAQSSQEELRSANEELQSTNEELQSTNEELTTSREEMQSMNEELQTVNAEQQSKVEELSRASSDMKNLLNSTDIATIFLDGALRVRRFTAQAGRLMKIIPGDVGRPITDLGSDLLYPELGFDVTEVLRTLARAEKEVATDGHWYMARIMPYRTLDDVIDGVVITFSEITEAKQLEERLRSSRERFAKLLRDLPPGIALLDEHGTKVPPDRVLARIADSQDVDFSSWKMVRTGAAPDAGGDP
jgi:two-component system CheB/CheR fusion protein